MTALTISEAILHVASLVLASVVFFVHFIPPNAFAAAIGLTLATLLIARLVPFRCLAELAPLPIVLGAIHHLAESGWRVESPHAAGWWLGLAGLLACQSLFELGLRRPKRVMDESATVLSRVMSFVTAAAALLILRAAIPDPWQVVGYLAFALIGASLWRFAGFPHSLEASVLPAAVAILAAFKLSLFPPSDAVTSTLVACAMVAGGVLIYGLIVAARHGARYRNLAWLPAILGTSLAFWIFATDELGVDHLTTVCWGITAVLVFVAGLFGGLQSYRLVGLVGIVLCLIRVFLVDIDDTLYRIIASFVLGLVSLLTGFLYHRFRHLIEAFDKDDSD